MRSRVLLLFLLPMIGCLHRPREAALLTPLASVYANGFPDDSIQPQYLLFADPLTASILRNLVRSGSYQLAPAGSGLFCPGNPAPGKHGYQLRLRVVTVMGDSAIVSTEEICAAGPYQTISKGVLYLLRKRNGKWTIEKPLSGSYTILG